MDSGNPEYNDDAGFIHCKCGTRLYASLLEQEEIVPLRIERRGLRTKVIVWAFVPMAIVLNAVTLFALYTYQRVTEELVVERNQELTRLLAGQLSIRLIDYVEMLSDLAWLPNTCLSASVSARSPKGVLVPWALMYVTSPGSTSASASELAMALAAPTPSLSGWVMWPASPLAPNPRTSA